MGLRRQAVSAALTRWGIEVVLDSSGSVVFFLSGVVPSYDFVILLIALVAYRILSDHLFLELE